MSNRRTKTTTAATSRPLEKDEVNALERAHRHAAETSAELHKLKTEQADLQQRLATVKNAAAAARADLKATTATIGELTARLTA